MGIETDIIFVCAFYLALAPEWKTTFTRKDTDGEIQKPIPLSTFFGKSHKGGLSCLCWRNRRQPSRDASEIESSRGENVLQMDFGRPLVACLA